MPYFTEIPDDELDYLPKYPPFYKGQVITGLSERDVGKEYAEELWIIATSDFSSGFVLGKSNVFGANTTQKYPYSYNYAAVKKYLQQRHALPEDFDYDHVVVRLKCGNNPSEAEDEGANHKENVPDLPAGGVIELYNYITGDYVLLNTSGSVSCIMQHQIYLRVGSPSMDNSGSQFSMIRIKTNEIYMKSAKIFIDGKNVMLGAHGLHVVGTAGTNVTWAEGVPLVPMSNVVG
jgi:hypothetical protein